MSTIDKQVDKTLCKLLMVIFLSLGVFFSLIQWSLLPLILSTIGLGVLLTLAKVLIMIRESRL